MTKGSVGRRSTQILWIDKNYPEKSAPICVQNGNLFCRQGSCPDRVLAEGSTEVAEKLFMEHRFSQKNTDAQVLQELSGKISAYLRAK